MATPLPKVEFPDLTRLDLRWHNRGAERILVEPFVAYVDSKVVSITPIRSEGVWLGFITDGGTIPRFAQGVLRFDKWGRLLPAYLVHDFGWSMRTLLGWSFEYSNRVLVAGALALGASDAEAFAHGVAVGSVFGRRIWERGTAHADSLAYHYAPLIRCRP